ATAGVGILPRTVGGVFSVTRLRLRGRSPVHVLRSHQLEAHAQSFYESMGRGARGGKQSARPHHLESNPRGIRLRRSGDSGRAIVATGNGLRSPAERFARGARGSE